MMDHNVLQEAEDVFFFVIKKKEEGVRLLPRVNICALNGRLWFPVYYNKKQALTMHSKGVITVQLHFIQAFGL